MSKMTNVNSSLAYEILLYLNNFYLGMFFVCEVAIGILKAINVSYPENALLTETGIFSALSSCLFFGALDYTFGSGVCYFLIYQTYIIRLEYIWCAVMLMFHALEMTFAILFIFTVCKNQQYD
ncbi:hypothetical protein MSG28_001992 [Choristoneura fumiferana]|uniref:Uncharacterized protein n=1 Tax=Choristoneura fumiferana TaxID=7141 RepID=A0ACC0JTV1_CHOFU|nr:hypothetical protein MSG28_001992 [Choristoneura fumiferana]